MLRLKRFLPVAANIQNELMHVALGDPRRDQRLLRLASRLAESPSRSIRAACRGWDESMGAYRLLNSGCVEMEQILDSHRQCAIERAQASQGDWLLVQDTTELDFTSHKALEGSGPLSTTSRRGFFLHNRLLIAEDEATVMGVYSAQEWAREDCEHGKAAQRKTLPIEEKESLRWLTGYEDACRIATEHPERRVIMVADRECDIYEIFAQSQTAQSLSPAFEANLRRADFVVRASRDRILPKGDHLFEVARQAPRLGDFEIEIGSCTRMVKVKSNRKLRERNARTANVTLRSRKVVLSPPPRPDRCLEAVELTLVIVREENPPTGQEPIEWILLTTLPVTNFEEAMRVVRIYTQRWLVEEYHFILKSGCRIETLSFQKSAALMATICLYMVVAWRILYLRDFARRNGELPADWFFTPSEIKAATIMLRYKSGSSPPSLEELQVMVARLGGYQVRSKNELAPGVQCLWRGLEKLRCCVEMLEALESFAP